MKYCLLEISQMNFTNSYLFLFIVHRITSHASKLANFSNLQIISSMWYLKINLF